MNVMDLELPEELDAVSEAMRRQIRLQIEGFWNGTDSISVVCDPSQTPVCKFSVFVGSGRERGEFPFEIVDATTLVQHGRKSAVLAP